MAINRLETFTYLIDTYKKYVIYYVKYIKSYANRISIFHVKSVRM